MSLHRIQLSKDRSRPGSCENAPAPCQAAHCNLTYFISQTLPLGEQLLARPSVSHCLQDSNMTAHYSAFGKALGSGLQRQRTTAQDLAGLQGCSPQEHNSTALPAMPALGCADTPAAPPTPPRVPERQTSRDLLSQARPAFPHSLSITAGRRYRMGGGFHSQGPEQNTVRPQCAQIQAKEHGTNQTV